MHALQFDAIAKQFRTGPVLADVTWTVAAGACVGLVGVNGAGKTTLLRCLLDFVTPDAGTIRIFGQDHRQPAARADLAYLPERFAPPYYMTGREWLAFARGVLGAPADEAAIGAVLDSLDLDRAALGRQVRHYSKGMTQKLGLAAVLLADKPLCVLDEPASGLDPAARALFKAHIAALRARGRTVLFTSHALEDVDALCDQMAVLHDGRLRFSGTPQDCRARYDADSLEQAFLRCITH